MTKKSQSRLQRDVAQGKRAAQSHGIQMAPVGRNPLKATENGGYKLTAADRILQECAQGLGLVKETPKNTCWDDLRGVYRECADMLAQHTMITTLLKDQSLLVYIDDLETFNANIKQFAADLGQMNKELQELYGLHAEKTGGSEDPQVVLQSFAVFEQYKLWMTKHDGVIKPTIMHILDQTNGAELRRQAARAELQKAQAEQSAGQVSVEVPTEQLEPAVLDVNTITDVEFNDDAIGRVVPAQARGAQSPIVTIDEPEFYPLESTQPQSHAHHAEHHKHVHHEA